ncbi:MAG: PAS domain-containing sensor histidine kinase [Verrucomicrobiales bacterium]|jgi:PAS domain S-box-containing protein|nr:PAS domain-containing sensor histidine kinase [Verrucomicrobiales bacterium]MDP6679535.1 ATP-binding protein [Verrucomicrobiota bacterium]
MPSTKSSFIEKVLGRIDALNPENLQSFVERLVRDRSFLETLFDTIEDGVLVADPAGRVTYLNASAGRLTGFDEAEALDQPVERLLPELDWASLQAADDEGGQSVVRREFELEYPRKRFIRLYAAPLDGEAKGSTGMALILHDATEAREQTHEAIESERIQALTLLAASVAHELGNPLNALSIHLQLMEREIRKLGQPAAGVEERLAKRDGDADEVRDIAAKLEKYIGVAKGEVNRLDYIVTQFLQAIRPSRPKLKKSSLTDTIEETIELLRPEFDNRGQAIKLEFAKGLPLALFDAAQIKQSLINLMKNSMHAMSTGGELTLRTGEAGGGVWVSLTDTGGGIPQEQIKRIFEPYYTTKEKGSGLGLMIVQRIVRDHDGRLELVSHGGKGTTFRIWLPIEERRQRLIETATNEA